MTEDNSFAQKLKYWEQLRNAIVHEDNLVNHRSTWLLTIEGFLFGGFFLVQNSVLFGQKPPAAVAGIEALLIIIFLGVIWICLISGSMNAAAFRQITAIREAWLQRYPEERRPIQPLPGWILGGGELPEVPGENSCRKQLEAAGKSPDFPPILGEFRYSYLWNTQRIPFVLIIFNTCAIIACLVIAITR